MAAKKKTSAKKAASSKAPTPPKRTDKAGSSGMGMNKRGVAARAQAAGDRANMNNAISNLPGQTTARQQGLSDAQIMRLMYINLEKGKKAFKAEAKKYGVTGLTYKPTSTDKVVGIVRPQSSRGKGAKKK